MFTREYVITLLLFFFSGTTVCLRAKYEDSIPRGKCGIKFMQVK